ncbi:hypothetical protein BKI52_10750 [marine bacterium AO1-C]|nr:hypothetical protein BKI52_10750 [marine bacterium AO1-C]
MNLVSKYVNRYAKVEVLEDQPDICIITATSSYIPVEEFKTTFEFIGTLVASEKIKKLIFDKRKLRVFHQPSMEWYFTEWKEAMYNLGLQVHRKILPEDEIFRTSVKIGRQKIEASFPDGKFKQMDIQYAESLEAAIAN